MIVSAVVAGMTPAWSEPNNLNISLKTSTQTHQELCVKNYLLYFSFLSLYADVNHQEQSVAGLLFFFVIKFSITLDVFIVMVKSISINLSSW